MAHSFHIPVLGLAFSIDTPIKVAQFGISSVISIVDDELLERMRAYYCKINNIAYDLIHTKEDDSRARRITAYLNLVHDLVHYQIAKLRSGSFKQDKALHTYFDLLPASSPKKILYERYKTETDTVTQKNLESQLKNYIEAGEIDVNIMSKVDKVNKDVHGNALPSTYTDASAALRGFANSRLRSSLIISAGLNPKLFSYMAEFDQFLPDAKGEFTKKIILKVSDFRSAFIQAKILAKKGVWVSEFRIESGLNCGGHAFATEGYLLGPILEEFKQKKKLLTEELLPIYQQALRDKGIMLRDAPAIKIKAQGGIGTAQEQEFLLRHYQLDGTGWGSPFLLVPEATTVEQNTLQALSTAKKEDFYVSGASPLGVPFNNFRHSTAEKNRLDRIQQGRPGAPCTKKYLISNTEFTTEPICTASREYQHKKIKELEAMELPSSEYQKRFDVIVEKTCLCEGLATSAYLKYDVLKAKENPAVSICPGPNTAYFSREYSLKEMVDHIYGRQDLLKQTDRPHIFINELSLYMEYLRKYVEMNMEALDDKKEKYIHNFKTQLSQAITYYANLKELHTTMCQKEWDKFTGYLKTAAQQLKQIPASLLQFS
ncbi:hypothetical protein G5B30_15485 [Sphingobacterium sp. SGG-5]|uniref:hypothetical protein n=1 Tax=Sphingobacterium sp. SGG-5 TaxID=2710881 RepID=UPI0013EE172D|nr:hypothetical protein [Sphingobacterium sp. SGG-5]NGM63311.1 hypothetical protein [Sphingobacterium sp. SGG-5]